MTLRSISYRFLALAVALFILSGCGDSGDSKAPSASIPGKKADKENSKPDSGYDIDMRKPEEESPAKVKENLFPEVVISTSYGDITLRLNADKAPRTVDNFLANYVDRGSYDNTIVHYVEPGSMVLMGGFDDKGEPIETRTPIFNEADNGLKNTKGTIAMTRMPDYVHSATSQFFINVGDNPDFDYVESEEDDINGYCVFGEVVEGMDVVQKIAEAALTGEDDSFPSSPAEAVIVKTVDRINPMMKR